MTDFHENLITPEQAITLDGLFARRVKRSAGRLAYPGLDRRSKDWLGYSWTEMGEQVGRWQRALAGEDLQPGDRVITEGLQFIQPGVEVEVAPATNVDNRGGVSAQPQGQEG